MKVNLQCTKVTYFSTLLKTFLLFKYSTGKSDRADQLGDTTTKNFAKKIFFAKSYFSIVIFNILKDENDSSKGKKVYLVSTTKLRFIRVPPK